MGSFCSVHLLSSLLCHWLVGRAGRRGSSHVVCCWGPFSRSWKLTEKEGVRERFAVVVKLPLTRLVCVDWGADRGRRAVR